MKSIVYAVMLAPVLSYASGYIAVHPLQSRVTYDLNDKAFVFYMDDQEYVVKEDEQGRNGYKYLMQYNKQINQQLKAKKKVCLAVEYVGAEAEKDEDIGMWVKQVSCKHAN